MTNLKINLCLTHKGFNLKIDLFIFFIITIILIFLQIGFSIENYGDQQDMNIEADYEYLLLNNWPLNSFDIDSYVITSLSNVNRNTKFYEPSWHISNCGFILSKL